MKKLLGSNYPYVSLKFADFISSMKENEIEEIEFFGAFPHCYIYDMSFEEAHKIRRICDENNIKVKVFTPEQWDNIASLAIDDYRVRARSLCFYEKALKIAKILGASYLSVIAGVYNLEDDMNEGFEKAKEGLSYLCAKAKELDMNILLEIDKETPVNNAEKALKMIEEIEADNIKILLDDNEVDDFIAAYEMLKRYVDHIQLSDKNEYPHIVPGKGNLDLESYLNALGDYDGCLGFELRGYTYQGNPKEASKEGLDYLKERIGR